VESAAAAASISINIGRTKNPKQRTLTDMASETTTTKRSKDTAETTKNSAVDAEAQEVLHTVLPTTIIKDW
jgi:hypothetical protein